MTTTFSKSSLARVEHFVSEFLGSEYFQSHQESEINSDFRNGGRFGRCMDAAENGSDGSTHAEVIDDYRSAFKSWLWDKRRGRDSADPERFEQAVSDHFDAVEAWHEKNGSLHQEIG